jgi:hypothetical protein
MVRVQSRRPVQDDASIRPARGHEGAASMERAMKKNPHAVALGRQGGKATSPAKRRAVRENGKKGGRPKGS